MVKKQTSLESFYGKGLRPNEETEEERTASKKKKAAFKRRYQESYLKYVLTASGDFHTPALHNMAIMHHNDDFVFFIYFILVFMLVVSLDFDGFIPHILKVGP